MAMTLASADHMIRKVGCNEFLLAFFNRQGGAVAVRIMKGILKKNGLTADKSLNSVLNSSPPIKCYYFHSIFLGVSKSCDQPMPGSFPACLLLGGEKPWEQGWL